MMSRSGSAARPACCRFQLPARGGSIDELAPFLNLSSRDDFVLVVAWLLARCARAGLTRYWRYPASRGRRRPSSRNSCGRWSIPASPRCGHCHGKIANCSSLPTTATFWLLTTSQLADLAVGYPLSAHERRCLRGPAALHRPGRGAVYGRPAGHSQRHRGRHHPARSRRPRHSADA